MKKRILSVLTSAVMATVLVAGSFQGVMAAATIAWSASPETQLSGWHYGGKDNAGAQVIKKMNEMDSNSVVSVTNGAANNYNGTAFDFNMNFTSGTQAEAWQSAGYQVSVNLDTTPYLYIKSSAPAATTWYALHLGSDWGTAPKQGDDVTAAYTGKIDLRTALGVTGGQQTFWVKLTLLSANKADANFHFDYLFIGNEDANPSHSEAELNAKASEYYANAIPHAGNIDRIAAAMKKAEAGQNITVGVIGGSITVGASASDWNSTSYASRVKQWWEAKFPGKVTFVNAGIGATTSYYGTCRAQRDLLNQDPDFVVVEFSVNDMGVVGADESYEGLLRQILKDEKNPGVLALAMMVQGGGSAQDVHLPILKNYDIPVVSYRDAVLPGVNAGDFTWKELTDDGTHPTDVGHYLAGRLIQMRLEEIYNQRNTAGTPSTTIPAPVTANGWEDSAVVDATNAVVVDAGDWVVSGTKYYTNVPGGRPLVIQVDKDYIQLMHLASPSISGACTLTMDGTTVISLNTIFPDGWGDYSKTVDVLRATASGTTHTLSFSFDASNSAGNSFTIERFLLGAGATPVITPDPDPDPVIDPESGDVNGKYNTTTPEDVYNVDVTWGAMEFDYNAGTQKWNAETHKWEADPSASAGWVVKNNSNTVTLANHSSKAVNASFAFTANTEYTELTGSFTYENASLINPLALEMPQADTTAKEYVVSFTPSGSIPSTHSADTYAKVGSITVTLS